jgi:hypothetical protein
MQGHKSRIKSSIAGFIIAGVCLLSFPAAAQQTGPQSKQGTVSDDDFIRLHQQIKELKNPTFRAFLRIRLLSWESPEPGPMRRQAAIEVATQGVTDLCEHQSRSYCRQKIQPGVTGSIYKKGGTGNSDPALRR